MIRNRFNCLLNSIHKQAHYQLEPRAHTLQLTTCTTKQKINSLRLLLLFTRLGFFSQINFTFFSTCFRARKENERKKSEHSTTQHVKVKLIIIHKVLASFSLNIFVFRGKTAVCDLKCSSKETVRHCDDDCFERYSCGRFQVIYLWNKNDN